MSCCALIIAHSSSHTLSQSIHAAVSLPSHTDVSLCCCRCCCAAGEAAKGTADAVGAKASSAAAAVKEGLSEARQHLAGASNTASDKARTWLDAVQVCTLLNTCVSYQARVLTLPVHVAAVCWINVSPRDDLAMPACTLADGWAGEARLSYTLLQHHHPPSWIILHLLESVDFCSRVTAMVWACACSPAAQENMQGCPGFV